MPVSQAVRLRSAVVALRETRSPLDRRPLNAAERSQYAKRLLEETWFRRTFTVQRFGWRPTWKGDEITLLHELANYLVPRATWAVPRGPGEKWVRRETCWSLLLLVQHKLGRDAAKALRQAYRAAGVKYRPRRVMSAAQKAALAERMFKPKRRTLARVAATPGRRRISFDDE